MGKTNSRQKGNKDQAEYIKFLHNKQKKLIRLQQKNAVQELVKFSFLCDLDNQEVDWKILYEDCLEEYGDKCFWAKPMLEYDIIINIGTFATDSHSQKKDG